MRTVGRLCFRDQRKSLGETLLARTGFNIIYSTMQVCYFFLCAVIDYFLSGISRDGKSSVNTKE